MIHTTPISSRKLCYEILKVNKDELLALVADHESYYKPYVKIKRKPNGDIKKRDIEPSIDYLKNVQRLIDRRVLKPALLTLPEEIMGGRKGYSVIMNASIHKELEALMKYDVEKFFPSIKTEHVFNIFRYRLNFCEEAASILTLLTTYHGHVPQGAPTSTSLAIFALENTCIALKSYCDMNSLKLSIWVDDITISGSKTQLTKSRYDINQILNRSTYKINLDKDSGILQKGSKLPRSVTGIIIDNNGRLTIGRKKMRNIRNRIFRHHQVTDKLKGRLLFLRQVNPKQAAKLFHIYQRDEHKTKDSATINTEKQEGK